jgi:hypothetical protein
VILEDLALPGRALVAKCSVPYPAGHEPALRASNILIGELDATFTVPCNWNRSGSVIIGSGIISRIGVVALIGEETDDVGLARVGAEVVSLLMEIEGRRK